MYNNELLLKVSNVTREFPLGTSSVQILKGVDLEIYAGEFVAIIGQSGSGKSTLMNILGCLDQPTHGTYQIKGIETQTLQPDDLAKLRREYFGFIFQRYHLLSELTAISNVEVPAIYAGVSTEDRNLRATALLKQLGLSDKLNNKPNQLSGGQQQRVSIARALMNGGDIILADEPTGALDKNSGIDVMQILLDLNQQGHTIIMVTHDSNVAKNASRIIEISDGKIISDYSNTHEHRHHISVQPQQVISKKNALSSWAASLDNFKEAFRMALLAMKAHQMRTFLTMLGIIIGIASVVAVVALGQGTQEKILEDINSLGSNTISIYQGKGFGDSSIASQMKTLVPADADALSKQPYVDFVSPKTSVPSTIRFKNKEINANVNGVAENYFSIQGLKLQYGQPFDKDRVNKRAQDVVIDHNTKKALFASTINPVGKIILLGKVPSRIIGVLEPSKTVINTNSLEVYLPYTTVMGRMLGLSNLNSIEIKVKEQYVSSVAENAILALLYKRHGHQDVFAQNTDSLRATVRQTTSTLTLLISTIAVISLVVGGIGVMNIMLVSVTERTKEIGVRMAVGARQDDILRQFLIESILVCMLGGIAGVLLALGLGQIINHFAGSTFQLIFSTFSIVVAFLCSSIIGVVFGFMPARNAAQLNPIDALARE